MAKGKVDQEKIVSAVRKAAGLIDAGHPKKKSDAALYSGGGLNQNEMDALSADMERFLDAAGVTKATTRQAINEAINGR